MDNRIFNVNGRTKQQLALAVKLLLLDEYGSMHKVSGWYFSKTKGFVLTWNVGENAKAFTDRLGNPEPIMENELVDLLWQWLDTDEAKTVSCTGWDVDTDHDGHNELGWRLYVEDWGCVLNDGGGLNHYSIGAFKPAYLWYGK